jgi:hypothetical protein
MTEHLFIKGLGFQKDLSDEGRWSLTKIVSNAGSFQIGPHENARLDAQIVERFCSYVAQTLRPEIEGFLQEEPAETKESPKNES